MRYKKSPLEKGARGLCVCKKTKPLNPHFLRGTEEDYLESVEIYT